MQLTDVLEKNKEPLKLASITLSNEDFEELFRDMIRKETGVDLEIRITTEWGTNYIMLNAPEWENDKLSKNKRRSLEKKAYSFDFPDEEFNYLIERLFGTANTSVYIESQKFDVTDNEHFSIAVYIQLDHFERLLAELGIKPGSGLRINQLEREERF